MDYTAWGFTQADNFAHVQVDPAACELIVQFYGSDGQPLETVKKDGTLGRHSERLKLEKW
jgi:alkaline phosphatase D